MDWRRLAFIVLLFVTGVTFRNFLVLKSVITDWKYRVPIYITETAGKEYTNATIQLTIDTQSLINLGKMKPDCSDIRFYYVNSTTENETKIPYWIQKGCGTTQTKIWIKVPYIPPNSTVTVYMYYGNPHAKSESNKSAFQDIEIFVGKYFKEHSLHDIYHRPSLDISDYCWRDAGRDAFDNYGWTRIFSKPNLGGQQQAIIIKPYEVGGERYRLQHITFSDGREFIIYKDMLPGQGRYSTDKAVLRTVILPANERALDMSYSVKRWGNLGSDGCTHHAYYEFTCNVNGETRTYRYVMTWDSPNQGSGDPNIAYFMFCAGYSNTGEVVYDDSRSRDNLQEFLKNARGLCVLYLAPTDNKLNDGALRNFFCQEIQYFEQFAGKYFKVDENGNIIAVGKSTPKTIRIEFGQEERLTTEPDTYRGVDIQVADTYERGEVATVYAKLDTDVEPKQVLLEIIDGNGNRVYGPVNMTEISPYIYSHKLNTSILEPGTYLVRVLIWLKDNRIFGGVAPIKIQTQFSELKATIKEEIAQVKDYLENVIYPKLTDLETKIDNLTSFSYIHLIEIKQDLEATHNEVLILQDEIKNVNATLYNELQEVKQRTEEILSKVNQILNLIQSTVITYLQGINNRVNTIYSDVEHIKQEVDQTVVPKLNIIETYLQNINETILNINESMQKGFKDVSTQLELLTDNVERIMLYVDEVEALLKCESSPENSVCARLEKLKQDILDIKSNVLDVKTAIQDLDSYIRNVLMPRIDEVYYNTQSILNNQTKIYNKLIEAYQEIQEVKTLSDTIYTTLQDIHTDLANKLQEQSQKLDALNQTVYQTLLEIREKVLPKLDSISTNLDTALEKLEIIRQKMDCEINSTICSKLNTIINDILILKKDIQEVKTNIKNLEPIKTDISQLLTITRAIADDVDDILGGVSGVSYETKEIKESLKNVEENISAVVETLESKKAGTPTAGVLSVIPTAPSTLGIAFVIAVLVIIFIYLSRKQAI